jgi:hypothetical protein
MAPLRRTTRRRTASRTLVASQGWERVGVLPSGDHTGRLRQPTGKAGGIGMALVAALQDLSSKNDGALQNMGLSVTQLVTRMQTKRPCTGPWRASPAPLSLTARITSRLRLLMLADAPPGLHPAVWRPWTVAASVCTMCGTHAPVSPVPVLS